MGFFSDITNFISDVTGIRELSPEYTRQHEEGKVRRQMEAERKSMMRDLKIRMRSKNAKIRREAKAEFSRIQKEGQKEMASLERSRVNRKQQMMQEQENKLSNIRGAKTSTSASTKTGASGPALVKGISRLGSVGPVGFPQRSTQKERDTMERRPK